MPKKTFAPIRPRSSAPPQTTTITHHARRRALRFSMVARAPLLALLALVLSLHPTIDAMARNPAMLPMSHKVGGSAISGMDGRGESGASDFPETIHSGAGAREKFGFILTILDANWGAEAETAKKRDGQQFTLGQDAIHIVEEDGDEFDIGASACEMKKDSRCQPHFSPSPLRASAADRG